MKNADPRKPKSAIEAAKKFREESGRAPLPSENTMSDYISGNKEAWEEAFDQRDAAWGADIAKRVREEDYPFFEAEAVSALQKYDLKDKSIGQFCCNNGRELLSLVRATGSRKGTGFDIAGNQVLFANEKAKELEIPCEFIATNILEIDDRYRDSFDFLLITIGALCWFKDLDAFFKVAANCMKDGAAILINEQHPFTNMIASPDDAEYDANHPLNCAFSYFEHEWTGNGGMYYMTKKNYQSKTFTDYTHSVSEIIGAMCNNHILVTNMREFDHDISGMFENLNQREFPLSMILEGRKVSPDMITKA